MNNAAVEIATRFYTAFQQKNAPAMIENYHPQLKFNDPAFGNLSYSEASAMWKMLCESAKDLKIEFEVLKAEEDYVESKWIANYKFSKTNRLVKNEIIAQMHLEDGLVIKHVDIFNLHKWAKQALGFKGLLLGGTKFFKNKLHNQTGRQLKKYMVKNNLV